MGGQGPALHTSWLFALSLALSLFLPCRDPSVCVTSSRSPEAARPPGSPAKNYIVRFWKYRKAEDHRVYIEENLGSSDGWRWLERRNPASSFPTDFGLLTIEELHQSALIEELGRLELVKDVVLESSYTRSLFGDGGEKGVASWEAAKRPGKIFTSASCEGGQVYSSLGNYTPSWRRNLMMQRSQVTSLFGAERLWAKGYTGAKVKMAIFDTGIRADHPHFRKIKERTNWTNEDTLNDNLGHGTFVAGVIAGEDAECLGFAPDTEIYAFRVFTDAQVSYTSWFLDAFNYAIATNMDVLNLSIGGPDYLDLPFVEKVWELTSNNIIMVSAIGNDGPLYGTLNNPADQSDVIGVGGIDYDNHIASFSSRGMSTWEIPHGYGRVKPDVVAYGRDIMGSKISTGCKSLSGTSVASPVVAGAVCLLVSVIPEGTRKDILNPASMKQALVEGASKLSGPNMYEQGAGRLDLLKSYEILKNYQPRASIFPSVLDYTDCPYSWPFCRQPLYAGAMPVIFNATILNGMGVIGFVDGPPTWQPFDELGNLLSIRFTYSDVIWPWTGFLALHMQIKEEGAHFSGIIEGIVTVKVYSPPLGERGERRSSSCVLSLKIRVVPTPPRSKRILWDQFHNIKYPPGYIPRDSLDVRNDILDWHGDHLHTNFHIMFNMLIDAGFYIETLGSPFTCFDASRYGTLLMVDLEDEYFAEEIEKLRDDVVNGGLGLVVFAEWYNVDSMVKMRFFDDNTRSWWTPITGGANIPAINELLAPFGVAFGDKILNGDFSIDGEQSHYASGTDIIKFPARGYVHSFQFQDHSESGATQNVLQTSGMTKVDYSILGLLEVGGGRLAVYGDSNCLDSSHMVTNCYWLLRKILDFTNWNIRDPVLFSDSAKRELSLHDDDSQLPSRRTDVNFSAYSAVVGKELICGRDSRFEVWGTKGYRLQLIGRNRKLPGYPTVDLGSDLNGTMERSNLRWEEHQKVAERNLSETFGRKNFSKNVDFLGFLNDDELDAPTFMAGQWLGPIFVAATCLALFLSYWRVRQRRRRRRKPSGPARSSSMV
uniref:Membrane-bound transcription factor site-1 protease n=1 Tax=Anthurium amnicola TaxID=1678845 RepID=A0A1D1ZCL4_9ARAE